MKALDVAQKINGKVKDFVKLGYKAFGLYLRMDRCDKATVDEIHANGAQCFFVYERGMPTTAKYFNYEQGRRDGQAAVDFAKAVGIPLGKQLFSAVDYDASPRDLPAITDYQRGFQESVKHTGYLASVYGSGLVCAHLVDHGYAHCGWLSCSSGWTGFNDYKKKAAIVQSTPVDILGFDCDPDTINDESVLW